MTLQPGDPVQDFSARSDDGSPVQLSAYAGGRVLLFFFPNVTSTHCQMQARRYQTLEGEFTALGVQLLGVSVDSRTVQSSFRELCKLSFPLISDGDHALSNQFGVLTQTDDGAMIYARRTTFLIGADGRVEQRWDDVNPNTNAAEVLAELQSVPSS
jgi:thioredoxin-dependent peroxiredoxin